MTTSNGSKTARQDSSRVSPIRNASSFEDPIMMCATATDQLPTYSEIIGNFNDSPNIQEEFIHFGQLTSTSSHREILEATSSGTILESSLTASGDFSYPNDFFGCEIGDLDANY